MFRNFDINDYEKVLKFWEESGLILDPYGSDAYLEIQKKIARDPELFILAEDENGKLIGSVMGTWDGRRGMVYHLAVDLAYRKKGLGQELMNEVERRLKSKGCLRYFLLVNKDNLNVLGFYEHLGWKIMPVWIMGKNIEQQ